MAGQELDDSLCEAAKAGDAALVGLRLAQGADPDARAGREKRSALESACQAGSPEAARALLERGADFEAANIYGERALHAAAKSKAGQSALVLGLLLEAGADPLAADNSGNGAIHEAGKAGNVLALDLLAAAGVPVDLEGGFGRTAMHWAAWNGHCAALARLMELGADPKKLDGCGKIPIAYAVWLSQADAFGLLAPVSGDLKSWRDRDGRCLLWWAAVHGYDGQPGRMEVIRALLDMGLDPRERSLGSAWDKDELDDDDPRWDMAGPMEPDTPWSRAFRSGNSRAGQWLLDFAGGLDEKEALARCANEGVKGRAHKAV